MEKLYIHDYEHGQHNWIPCRKKPHVAITIPTGKQMLFCWKMYLRPSKIKNTVERDPWALEFVSDQYENQGIVTFF